MELVSPTRLDCIDRPQAAHRYDCKGGHEPTPKYPKQAQAFTHIHDRQQSKRCYSCKAGHASNR
eukprot:6350336-Prymnesium_polylepis.1